MTDTANSNVIINKDGSITLTGNIEITGTVNIVPGDIILRHGANIVTDPFPEMSFNFTPPAKIPYPETFELTGAESFFLGNTNSMSHPVHGTIFPGHPDYPKESFNISPGVYVQEYSSSHNPLVYDGPGISPMCGPTGAVFAMAAANRREKMTNFEKVQEFHRIFSVDNDPQVPTVPDTNLARLRANLILEETKELLWELGFAIEGSARLEARLPAPIDLQKVAKESADLLYVTYGTAASLGIPIDKVYDEVHTSNMSKLTKDGQVLRREDGKVLKGPLYREPDLSFLVSKSKTD